MAAQPQQQDAPTMNGNHEEGKMNGANGVNSSQAEYGGGKTKQEGPVEEGFVAAKDKITNKKEKVKDKKKPDGGFDDTPVPSAPDGFIVKFIFVRAHNLPVSDFGDRSSDPYIKATLTSPGIRKRHKEDPDLVLRSKTIHKNVNPEWNEEWIVAGIPSSGFRLKCRLYDEDPSDHDDRLGNVTFSAQDLASWQGLREEEFELKKRMGSKRAYAVRGCVAMFNRSVKMSGTLVISAQVLGRSEKPYGKMYTLGDVMWTKHFSPMIGRLAGTKNLEEGKDHKSKVEKYDFQANQYQLQGPVPDKLYHRFVEFKPFVKGMFSSTGLRGRVLNMALHHQHARVYNYSSMTQYGVVRPRSEEAAIKFLDLVHYDEGGRIFTYVITIDGLMRFTETGKEFGIDLLSKHTMHSDVNIYIACSGEFFIRRLSEPDKSVTDPGQKTHPAEDVAGGPPHEPPPKRAKDYELIIDNDSGTYRPKAELLPLLKEFLSTNFPGLHVSVKECTDKKLDKMKDEQREMKKKQGKTVNLVQNSDDDISSSDEERLDAAGGPKKTAKQKAFAALEDPRGTIKHMVPGEKGREAREAHETQGDQAAEGSGQAP